MENIVVKNNMLFINDQLASGKQIRAMSDAELKALLCSIYDDGYNAGYDTGREDGFDDGWDEGYQSCIEGN